MTTITVSEPDRAPMPTTIVAPNTPAPDTTEPPPISDPAASDPEVPSIPELTVLDGYASGRDIVTLDVLPHALPSIEDRTVDGATVRAVEVRHFTGDTWLHEQIYADVERNAVLVVKTAFGPTDVRYRGDIDHGSGPIEEELDVDEFGLPWDAATRRINLAEGEYSYSFWDAFGIVSVLASGLPEDEVRGVVTSLSRRSEDAAGWIVGELPAGMTLWAEQTNDTEAAVVEWIKNDRTVAEVGTGRDFRLLQILCCDLPAVVIPDLTTTLVGGRLALVVPGEEQTEVVWQVQPGVLAVARATSDFDDDPTAAAIRLAQSTTIVDRKTWRAELGEIELI